MYTQKCPVWFSCHPLTQALKKALSSKKLRRKNKHGYTRKTCPIFVFLTNTGKPFFEISTLECVAFRVGNSQLPNATCISALSTALALVSIAFVGFTLGGGRIRKRSVSRRELKLENVFHSVSFGVGFNGCWVVHKSCFLRRRQSDINPIPQKFRRLFPVLSRESQLCAILIKFFNEWKIWKLVENRIDAASPQWRSAKIYVGN